MVECSGSGDVDTKTIAPAASVCMHNGIVHVLGLSGRVLRLNPSWSNTSGQWRLGLKNGFDLFPSSLKSRMKRERAEADRKAITETLLAAQSAVVAHCAVHGASGGAAGSPEADAYSELTKRVALLKESVGGGDDLGPIYDVVCWQDGNGVWRAAVDTRGDGECLASLALADVMPRVMHCLLCSASTALAHHRNTAFVPRCCLQRCCLCTFIPCEPTLRRRPDVEPCLYQLQGRAAMGRPG